MDAPLIDGANFASSAINRPEPLTNYAQAATRPRLRISLQWAGRRCPQHLLWNAGGIPHLTITNSRKGRGARSFDTLRPLRLCVRLYWRSVSTGHDREIATTGGCPSPSGVEGPVPLHGVGVGYIGLRNADGPHPLPLP
jgi:hypothetical protein